MFSALRSALLDYSLPRSALPPVKAQIFYGFLAQDARPRCTGDRPVALLG